MTTPLALIAISAHVATLLRVLTYQRCGARHRHHISWMAWAIIAVSGGSTIELALHMKSVGFFGASTSVLLAVFVLRARGNVACLLRSE